MIHNIAPLNSTDTLSSLATEIVFAQITAHIVGDFARTRNTACDASLWLTDNDET